MAMRAPVEAQEGVAAKAAKFALAVLVTFSVINHPDSVASFVRTLSTAAYLSVMKLADILAAYFDKHPLVGVLSVGGVGIGLLIGSRTHRDESDEMQIETMPESHPEDLSKRDAPTVAGTKAKVIGQILVALSALVEFVLRLLQLAGRIWR